MKRSREANRGIIMKDILKTRIHMVFVVEREALEMRATPTGSGGKKKRGGRGKRHIASSRGEEKIAPTESRLMPLPLRRCSSSLTESSCSGISRIAKRRTSWRI